jgi:uncharacterized protein (TIGR00255 family)
MIHSMTGFARREARWEWGSLSWEIRSVNHRYLEINWRLPEELRHLEADFRKLAGQHLKRGKVECALRLRWGDEDDRGMQLRMSMLQRLNEALDTVSAQIGNCAPVSPVDVLRWPGVVEEQQHDTDPAQSAALELLNDTLLELTEARRREGERIRLMLSERCDGVAEMVASTRERLPEIREALRQRLLDRIAKLELEPDHDRLEQELVLQAQKMDVDEELDRLDSHVAEVRRILSADEAAGRRLDFLMQEFNREANTLASKSQALETTRVGVELKVLIEQMREQIQNVE